MIGEGGLVLRAARGQKPTSAQLAQIRDDGYAISFISNRKGANGVAAPILDPEDRTPLGSISVAGPADRVPETILRAHAIHLKRACAQLAPQLATILGPHASKPQSALDITALDLVDDDE